MVITETSELDCMIVVVTIPNPSDFVTDPVAFSKALSRKQLVLLNIPAEQLEPVELYQVLFLLVRQLNKVLAVELDGLVLFLDLSLVHLLSGPELHHVFSVLFDIALVNDLQVLQCFSGLTLGNHEFVADGVHHLELHLVDALADILGPFSIGVVPVELDQLLRIGP